MKTLIRLVATALALTLFTTSLKASAELAPQLNLNAPRSLALADRQSDYDAVFDATVYRPSTAVLVGVIAVIGIAAAVGGCYLINQSFARGGRGGPSLGAG